MFSSFSICRRKHLLSFTKIKRRSPGYNRSSSFQLFHPLKGWIYKDLKNKQHNLSIYCRKQTLAVSPSALHLFKLWQWKTNQHHTLIVLFSQVTLFLLQKVQKLQKVPKKSKSIPVYACLIQMKQNGSFLFGAVWPCLPSRTPSTPLRPLPSTVSIFRIQPKVSRSIFFPILTSY